MRKPHESNLHVQLTGDRNVFFKSGKNYQDLRMETLDGVIIDEFRQQPKELWPVIIRPMLSKRRGWGDLLTTPNGFDHVYDLSEEIKNNPDWSLFHAPSTDAWWWTPEEIASVRKDMTEAEFRQEIMAEFVLLTSGLAYSSYSEANHRQELMTDWQILPIFLSCDFNVNPMAWYLSQFNKSSVHTFSEIYLPNTNTHECSKELIERLRMIKDRGWKSNKVIVTGDATGKARRTSATESDYAIIYNALKDSGFIVESRVSDSNPPVKERVNTVNARLRSASGEVSFTFDQIKCPKLLGDFRKVSWKQGAEATLDQDGHNSMLTHCTDSVGYLLCEIMPLKKIGAVGKVHVIVR